MARGMFGSQRPYQEESYHHDLLPLFKTSIREALKKTEEERYEGLEPLKETPPETLQGVNINDPLTVLKMRFVNGEISEEEYLRKKRILED